jgi:hypothetical protein
MESDMKIRLVASVVASAIVVERHRCRRILAKLRVSTAGTSLPPWKRASV